MLTEVKNQFKISLLSIKFALMKEMLNKASFIMNIVFMILNNASFIIEWLVLFSLKDNIGGYTFKQVLLLWGISSSTFGFSHFFFKNAYSLSDTITNGKLDSYLVQPKNVLLSAITTNVEPSAIGDMLYGYIMLIVYGITTKSFFLFTLFMITGGIILTDISIILSSLSFWFDRSDIIADTGNNLMTNFSTYPEGIFKGLAKIILFSIIPVGIVNFIPIKIITKFNIPLFLIIISVTILLTVFSFFIFNKGLKRYSGSNLMISRI